MECTKCLDALGTTVLVNHGGPQALDGECEGFGHRLCSVFPLNKRASLRSFRGPSVQALLAISVTQSILAMPE